MVFGLGPTELLVILGIVIFFYGGKRVAQVGEGLGRSISEFKKGTKGSPDAIAAAARSKPEPSPVPKAIPDVASQPGTMETQHQEKE